MVHKGTVLVMKMPRQMVQFTVPQKEWLGEEALRLGVSVAELLRRIIDEYRAGKADLLK